MFSYLLLSDITGQHHCSSRADCLRWYDLQLGNFCLTLHIWQPRSKGIPLFGFRTLDDLSSMSDTRGATSMLGSRASTQKPLGSMSTVLLAELPKLSMKRLLNVRYLFKINLVALRTLYWITWYPNYINILRATPLSRSSLSWLKPGEIWGLLRSSIYEW